jgi:hypothetical protein
VDEFYPLYLNWKDGIHMSTSHLIRWSGLAALLGGALFALFAVVEFALFSGQPQSAVVATGAWGIVQVFYIVACVLISLGLVGAYTLQAGEGGSLGLAAFLLALTGTIMVAGAEWSAAFIAPWVAQVASPEVLDAEPTGMLAAGVLSTFILFGLGWFLFSLVLLRTGVLSRGTALVIMIGAISVVVHGLLGLPFNSVVFGVALAWMGKALRSGIGEEILAPEGAM